MSRRIDTALQTASQPRPRRRQKPPRRGITSTLAMLYLILFSSLAIGFYAAVNTSVQVANNETKGKRTLLAAESGMAFVRHILSNTQIPHGTPADEMWPQMTSQIKAQLDGKAVVNYQTLQD